jgi:hypothetical protein
VNLDFTEEGQLGAPLKVEQRVVTKTPPVQKLLLFFYFFVSYVSMALF